MAVDDLSPVGVSGGTEELRALLVGYAGVLERIDGAPPVLWAGLERPRILRWLRFPAPRALVSVLLVRHVSRCISALKRGAARWGALADDAPGPVRDLKMLKQFKQSLPTGVRLAVIAPLAGLGILFVAFIVANLVIKSHSGKLLADLTTAAFTLDRGAALAAFEKDRGEPLMYLGATGIMAQSAILVIALLLPAFSVKRRLLRSLTGLEARGFAALGCRRIQDLELDLVAQLLLVIPVAYVGLVFLYCGAFGFSSKGVHERGVFQDPWSLISLILVQIGGLIVLLVGLAGVELFDRYAVRRTNTARQLRPVFTLFALWLVQVGSVAYFIQNVLARNHF
jgi:hypothetical protein